MSISLSRVPKKAALTIWSGLAVGTSCTLVLVVEDRRRRINQASSAVRNAERLRSSRQYHASELLLDESSVVTKPFEEIFSTRQPVAIAEDYPRPRTDEHKEQTDSTQGATPGQSDTNDHNVAVHTAEKRQLTHTAAKRLRENTYKDWQREPDYVRPEKPDRQVRPIEPDEPPALEKFPLPLVRPWRAHPGLWTPDSLKLPQRTGSGPRANRSKMFPSPDSQPIDIDQNVQRINRAAHFGDNASLDEAIEVLRKSLGKLPLTTEDRSRLAQSGIRLCVKCQENGMMEQAMRALHSAVELGPMSEADYFAANPQPVVDYAVSAAEEKITKIKENGFKAPNQVKLLLRKRMDRTIMLFMPNLTEGTLSASRVAEWVPAAEKCMHLAFDLENMTDKAVSVFGRIRYYGADPDGRILLGYMERLSKQHLFRRVVNTFNLNRHNMAQLDTDTWRHIGDIVTDAVDQGPEQNAAKVLKHMVEFCPVLDEQPVRPLRTTWMTKLLYCHWMRVRSFDESLTLFKDFESMGGFDKIVFKDGMYRTMIQIAVEAEQWQELDGLLDALLQIKPSAAKEARILGLLALAKARIGDWNAVWEDFRQMEIKDRIEFVFSPILHEFIKTHTIGETEDFLKLYIQELNMPISSHAVNMIADRYGHIRDHESFLDWLSWCSKQGFEIDAAYGNAIIHNCRRRWDFSFEDTERIYRTLQALSPKFADQSTENAMVSAALTTHKKAKIPFLKKQVGFATRKFHRWTMTESASDMRIDMRYAFSTRDFTKVLFLYRVAADKRNIDEGHLRLAVQASLKVEKSAHPALKMIRSAKERGMDVRKSITLVFILQLRIIFQGNISDPDLLLRQVQNCIASFEENDLEIGHQALLRVAHQLLEARHIPAAISFGLSALRSKGVTHPDDVPTFQLFMVAYGYRADVRGIKWTLAGAVHSEYYHKRAVYTALLDARKHLSKQIQSTDVKQAQRVIQQGLEMVRHRRQQLTEDRKHIERHALDIMARAALEAEDQPTCEEATRKRDAAIAEMAERNRLEDEAEVRKIEARRVEMQARRAAFEEADSLNQEEADALEEMLMSNKHEVRGDF